MSKFVIHKIELEPFLNMLVEYYNQGVNYIDINADLNQEEDNIHISIKREYYKEIPPLTDDDIEQL